MQVFEFLDYRKYLEARFGQKGERNGLRLKASEFLRCHSTYFSQVLSGKAHISLEHAEALNGFFHHSKEESAFFLLLVLHSRAGTPALRSHFDAQIAEVLEKRNQIRNRLKGTAEISAEDRDRFYSSYLYGALHVLVSIPGFQSLSSLARVTGISPSRLADDLEFLIRIGLIQLKSGVYSTGQSAIHLGSDSHLVAKHHVNWRFHAIQNLSRRRPEDLHYSAVLSLSEAAAKEIRESLLKTLQKHMEIVGPSREETAFVYNFDFYRFGD